MSFESQSKQFKVINSPYFILSTLTFIGLFFRMYIGRGVSMHTDEGQFAYVTHIRGVFNLYKYITEFSSRDQPIFMYLLTYVWKLIVGSQPPMLRLLPALISSLGIFFSGFLCLRLTNNKFLSLSLAILILVSPISVRYAYDLTPYCLVSLLAPISFFIFLEHLRDQKYVPNMVLILVNIVFLNTHYYAFFIVAAQMIIFFALMLRSKQLDQIKNHIIVSLIYFLCAAIPLSLLFNPSTASFSQGWMRAFTPHLWNDIAAKTIGLYDPILFIYRILIPLSLIGIGIYKGTHRTLFKGYFFMTFVYFVLTIVVIKTISYFTWPFLGHYRYLMILFPTIFFAMLLGMDDIKIKPVKYILMALLTAILLFDTIKNQPHINQDFEGAFAFLHEREKDSPFMLFFLPSGYNKPLALYYSKYFGLRDTMVLDNSVLEPSNTDGLSGLLKFMQKNEIKKAYFMEYYLNEMKPVKDAYLQRLNEIFNVEHAQDFQDINLYAMTPKVQSNAKH